jgi:hypothetical protein
MKQIIGNWIIFSLFCAFGACVFYFMYIVQMADYDAFLSCNPQTGINRMEWVFGFRPVDNSCIR